MYSIVDDLRQCGALFKKACLFKCASKTLCNVTFVVYLVSWLDGIVQFLLFSAGLGPFSTLKFIMSFLQKMLFE